MVEVGTELIDELQRQLNVEERWALADKSGRTWWLSALPLRIWADEVAVPDAVPWVRVHAATVVAEGVDPNPDVYRAIAAENNVAIMSALVLDAERRELSLHCQATFNTAWHPGARLELLRTAVALQAAVGDLYGSRLQLPAGQRPRPAHPTSGRREAASDLVKSIIPAVRLQSTKSPPVTQGELDAIQAELAEDSLWSIAGSGRLSLEVEAGSDVPRVWFAATNGQGGPWDPEAAGALRDVIGDVAKERNEDPALFHQVLWRANEGPEVPQTGALRISTTDDHPIIGKGVFALLLMPGRHSAGGAGQLSNALNLMELAPPYPLTQLGAWAARDVGDGWEIGYSSFVPATFTGTQDSANRVAMIADITGEIAMRGRIAAAFMRERRAGLDA